jgi:integrase
MEQEYPYRAEQIRALQEIHNVKQRIAALDDSLHSWMDCYLDLLIRPIRDEDITAKIARHLARFYRFFYDRYGHDHISSCLKRDVVAWQTYLAEDLAMAPATVNNHVASLSGFMRWVDEQDEHRFPAGNPCKGMNQLPLPPLEPRALTKMQVASLKNLCDRLPRLYERKGQRYHQRRRKHPEAPLEVHRHSRPWRDRAMVYFLLATGVRREELLRLNLEQVQPHTPTALRNTQLAKISNVYGKGKTRRNLYLSSDARTALADYLEYERVSDAAEFPHPQALFLRTANVHIPTQTADDERNGRLAPNSINHIVSQVGLLHDAEFDDPARHISPLRPHDLRHTFGFFLSQATGADEFELERRLGHRNRRYIGRYTAPPEEIAASYIEKF